MTKCINPGCDNEVGLTKKGIPKKHCSLKCRGQHNSIVGTEKRKQTCLDRFGSVSNLMCDDTKDKIKKTLLDKYGVEHQMQLNSVKDKIKKTLLDKYGVDNISKADVIKEKKVNTSMERFGVSHPLQSAEVQQRRKEKSILEHGVDHYSKTPQFKVNHPNQSHILNENYQKLKDPVWLLENNTLTCETIGKMLGVTKDTVSKSYRRLNVYRNVTSSTGEYELLNYVKSLYSGVIETQTRKIISPLELDIYLPELNLAFEYHGLYWHSELNGKEKSYHIDKTRRCNEMGIRLVQIYENEWLTKEEIVKSRISGMLSVNTKIHGRKCKIITLTKDEYLPFFNSTHIQDELGAHVCYGLEYKGEIVAAMSFGKSRYNKIAQWELLRFSNKLFTNVVGGASKLFAHFVKTHKPETVVSYSDLRWNTGQLYSCLGFTKTHDSDPNYWYTNDYTVLHSRVKYQKHKLVKMLPTFDPTLSEWQNMQNNGYDRIWDCGNSVFTWSLASK